MDPDVEVVLEHYKHLFPDFSVPHAVVYKLLWRVNPMQVEEIVKHSGLSNATVYRMLHDLTMYELIERTNFKPVGYYVPNPMKDYNSQLKKIVTKLEKGAQRLENLLENSTGLSGELFLVKKDGGQQKLLLKQNHSLLNDAQQLLEIKKVCEEQLKEVDKQKLRAMAIYK
ncbi:MAG: helix-turn-helix domain-containing protein [archaeon]|jgi:predicted transcriptional regulator